MAKEAKNVVPFPAPKTGQAPSRITIHVGTRQYTIHVPGTVATLSPPRRQSKSPGPVQELEVRTRFLRLREPAALGDRIDGGRVCWIGGWDRNKILFVVMVESVTRKLGQQTERTEGLK
jgi:hypothetical protein